MEILILSDIHFGKYSEHPELRNTPLEQAFANSMAKGVSQVLHANSLNPELLLVPGDLTSVGSPMEFRGSSNLLTCIRDELGISEEKLVLTYGNHDVDWQVCKVGGAEGPGASAYRELGAMVGSLFARPPAPDISGPVPGSGVYKLDSIALIVLNSAIHCYDNQTYAHGRIAEAQLQWLSSEVPQYMSDCEYKLAVIHHHLVNLPYPTPSPDISTLEEGANLLSAFSEIGIDIVIHGHRHHPIIHTTTQTGWSKPLTFICAGSFGVDASHRSNGQIPNTLHYLDIQGRAPNGAAFGKVHTFEQASPDRWRYLISDYERIPVNPCQWFGYSTTGHEAGPLINEIIDGIVRNPGGAGYWRLPEYEQLEISLKCLPHTQLNRLISENAMNRQMIVTGKYPERCIISFV